MRQVTVSLPTFGLEKGNDLPREIAVISLGW